MRRRRLWRRTTLMAAAVVALAGGCGGGDSDGRPAAARVTPPALEPLARLGRPEGTVRLVAPAGYVEDGSRDPAADWVSGFERASGCEVEVRVAASSSEAVALVRTGRYDGVAAFGDATLRLIDAGDVAPLNTRLVPNYADLFPALVAPERHPVEGRVYGVPHGRGAHVLAWRQDEIPGALNSWAAVFDPAQMQAYKGRVTAHDSPMAIAAAALYLKAHEPDLGIEDVYELDDRQFRAALALLAVQREHVGTYWSDEAEATGAFARGDAVVGAAKQGTARRLRARDPRVPVAATLPKEGSTGWSAAWMIHARARHPTCTYRWLNHIIGPAANAAAAEWLGEAPANRRACELTSEEDYCERVHAADEGFFDRVAPWTAPTRDCGDARGNVCKDHAEWEAAWRRLTGR